MKKIPGNILKKSGKNHGNIIEFCQSEKVGTLHDSHWVKETRNRD